MGQVGPVEALGDAPRTVDEVIGGRGGTELARGRLAAHLVELLTANGLQLNGFYRFDDGAKPRPDPNMDLRDAIQRIALQFPAYGRPRITAKAARVK